jgi:hypothetical protein
MYYIRFKIEKNAILVHEVTAYVRFGHKLANREFWITKLSQPEFFGHTATTMLVFFTKNPLNFVSCNYEVLDPT